jgi:adenylate cyclase
MKAPRLSEMADWACAACGSANPEGTRFCGQCGAKAPEAAAAEERRLVTAVFADISGFTPLADRLDPEELLEVIDPVVSALSSVVGRYEGFVEKFAGDALLALFGAPVSHDDDAARALHVALEMHAELERIKDELPEDARGLTLHVGVNSGHGIARIIGSEARTDYAVLGDAVILAQRLESAAPPGETYVSETTVRLAEHLFELEPVGELTLKGKSEPVRAWRLLGARTTTSRPGTSRMICRERELAALDDGLRDGGVVTVTGEPGVGKSRLLDEAQGLAAERGLRWLPARCLSYGAALPYWPFAELLRREGAPDDPFVARLLGERGPELEPEAFRRGLHDAIAAWLAGLAPAVLALEDVHWIDAASRALLGELVRRGSVTLVLSGRPEAETVLAELAPQRTRIVLTPLDEAGVAELIGAQLGEPPPPELAAFIGGRTAGNPFFVQELVRALQESGALAREDERWRMRAGWDARDLPPTIEEVLSGRMDGLSRAAASTLQAASVIGRRSPESLLGAIGADLGALGELVAAGFLHEAQDEDGRVLVFHHALVQDVAYARLLRKQRRTLHGAVAAAAEELYGNGDDTVDLLARHLYLAGAGPKAVKFLLRAAQRARRLYANQEAILHLTRCAELVPEDLELLLELADLHELVGDYDRALGLYEQVRDATGDVRAWRGLASVHRKRGEYWEALAIVDDAFADRRLTGVDLSALWLEGGWALSLTGRYGPAVDVLTTGLEVGGAGATGAQLLLELGRAMSVDGDLAGGLERANEARARFEALDDIRGLATALRVIGSIENQLGRPDEAAAALREGLALAERIGIVEEIGGCLINLGMVELERGRLDDAHACNRRAIEEFERVGHGSGRAWGYSNLAWSLTCAGDYEEARTTCEESLAFSRAIGHVATVAETLDTLSVIDARTERHAEAAAHAEQAAELFTEMGALPKALDAWERAASAWTSLEDEERARTAAARARSLSPAG